MQFYLSVKQNPSPAWLLGPQAWGKLTAIQFYLSVKQNPGPAWLLGPLAWGKLITQKGAKSWGKSLILSFILSHIT